jgi:hypothetical protein
MMPLRISFGIRGGQRARKYVAMVSYPPPATGCQFNVVKWVKHGPDKQISWHICHTPDGSFCYDYTASDKFPTTEAKCWYCDRQIMVFDGRQWDCPACHAFYVPLYPPPYIPKRLAPDEALTAAKRLCRQCNRVALTGARNQLYCPGCARGRTKENRKAFKRRKSRVVSP